MVETTALLFPLLCCRLPFDQNDEFVIYSTALIRLIDRTPILFPLRYAYALD